MEEKLLYRYKKEYLLYGLSILVLAVVIYADSAIFPSIDNYFKRSELVSNDMLSVIFLVLVLNGLWVGLIWFFQKTILEMRESSEAGSVDIKTWSIFKRNNWKTYSKEIFKTQIYFSGESEEGIKTPMIKLKTPVGKTLILDLSGEFYNNCVKKYNLVTREYGKRLY